MAERELAIVIRAKDLASKAIAGVNQQLGKIGSHASRGLANATRNIERGAVAMGAAVVGGLAYATKAAGDFEAQMNTLNTIAMTTGDAFSGELGEIGDNLRKLARDTGTPLEELTTAYYDLLSAGIKTADAQNVLTSANTLAIGGLASTAETIDLLTTAINSYGGDASKASEYADQFAVAIERGKVTAAEIAASFAQVGPLAASMGVGIDEISGLLANMTAKGTPAAEAFTQIRAAMTSLQRQTPEMKRVLEELGIANVETEVAARGLTPVFNDIAEKAKELGIPMIELTGRIEGTMFALSNTGPEFEAFEGHLAAVREGTGTAQSQMEQRQKGLNFQLGRMKALLNDAAITLGSKLIPKMVPMLEKLAGFIEDNQAQIEQFADDVAAGFEKAVKWAMSLDWNAIANSVKMAAQFGQGLVQAFLAMPDWVKQAVITGWGLNKLTGGALTGILGEVLKGSIKGLFNMNAGVVNVTGRVVNAPGGGVGGAAGGGKGGGKLGGLLGFLGVLGAAGAANEIDNFIGQDLKQSDMQWPFGPRNTPTILADIFGGNGILGGTGAGGTKTMGVTAPKTGGDRAIGGSFGGAPRDTGSGWEARFGDKLDKLATNDVIAHLARTNEMGFAGVGTSFQVGIADGLDPLGNIATQILARAENPKAPEVMAEIRGHLSGLEEIQAQYLANGDINLANKVQTNIDTLHRLIGTTDTHKAVTAALATQNASSDAAMLATARYAHADISGKTSTVIAKQDQVSGAVTGLHGPLGRIAAKNFSPVINVPVTVNSFVSATMIAQRAYQQRAYANTGTVDPRL